MQPTRQLRTVFLFLLLGACAAPEADVQTQGTATTDVAAVKDAIQAREKEWSAAYLTGNADAVAALYTADAASIPATGEWNRGRPAIAKDLRNQLDSVTFTAREDITDEVIPAGPDHVFEVGHYSATGTYKVGGKPRRISGRYVVLWRKDTDGVWRLHRDMGVETLAKP
jgi:uncharacterized protein (TIGR02246 family)